MIKSKIWKASLIAVLIIILVLCVAGFVIVNLYLNNNVTNVADLANHLGNVSVCDDFSFDAAGWGGETPGQATAQCYTAYAQVHPQENICPRILTDPKTHVGLVDLTETSYQMCVWAQVRVTGDYSRCDTGDAYCYVIAGEIKGGIDVCNQIKNTALQQECVTQYKSENWREFPSANGSSQQAPSTSSVSAVDCGSTIYATGVEESSAMTSSSCVNKQLSICQPATISGTVQGVTRTISIVGPQGNQCLVTQKVSGSPNPSANWQLNCLYDPTKSLSQQAMSECSTQSN